MNCDDKEQGSLADTREGLMVSDPSKRIKEREAERIRPKKGTKGWVLETGNQ